MKSPFPGMDPYLEEYWPDVHSSLATYARDFLNRQMPKGIRARIQESIAVETDDPIDGPTVSYVPDVTVSGAKTQTKPLKLANPIQASTPQLFTLQADPETIRSVRIETAHGGRLITAIEFLSPTNKITEAGREAYRRKREDVLASGASIVEVDLIRTGRNVTALPLAKLKPHQRSNPKVVIVRGWMQWRAEVYSFSVRDPLPTPNIPLRKTDEDITLDLNAILSQIYENGLYDSIDYGIDPEPELSPADAAWADELLKNARKR